MKMFSSLGSLPSIVALVGLLVTGQVSAFEDSIDNVNALMRRQFSSSASLSSVTSFSDTSTATVFSINSSATPTALSSILPGTTTTSTSTETSTIPSATCTTTNARCPADNNCIDIPFYQDKLFHVTCNDAFSQITRRSDKEKRQQTTSSTPVTFQECIDACAFELTCQSVIFVPLGLDLPGECFLYNCIVFPDVGQDGAQVLSQGSTLCPPTVIPGSISEMTSPESVNISVQVTLVNNISVTFIIVSGVSGVSGVSNEPTTISTHSCTDMTTTTFETSTVTLTSGSSSGSGSGSRNQWGSGSGSGLGPESAWNGESGSDIDCDSSSRTVANPTSSPGYLSGSGSESHIGSSTIETEPEGNNTYKHVPSSFSSFLAAFFVVSIAAVMA